MLEAVITGLEKSVRMRANKVAITLDYPEYINYPEFPVINDFSVGQRLTLEWNGLAFQVMKGVLDLVDYNTSRADDGNHIQWSYQKIITGRNNWKNGSLHALKTAVSHTGIPLSVETVEEGFTHYLKAISDGLVEKSYWHTSNEVLMMRKSALKHLQGFYDVAKIGGFRITEEFAHQMYDQLIKSLNIGSVYLFRDFSKIPLSKGHEEGLVVARQKRIERDEQQRREHYGGGIVLSLAETLRHRSRNARAGYWHSVWGPVKY